jgi:hypothetical protein
VWLSATIGGSLVGGVVGWWLTRDVRPAKGSMPWGMPSAGILGASQTKNGTTPVYGIAWTGNL